MTSIDEKRKVISVIFRANRKHQHGKFSTKKENYFMTIIDRTYINELTMEQFVLSSKMNNRIGCKWWWPFISSSYKLVLILFEGMGERESEGGEDELKGDGL